MNKIQKIVAGIDFSEESKSGLKVADSWACALEVEPMAVHVSQLNSAPYFFSALKLKEEDILQKLKESAESEIRKILDSISPQSHWHTRCLTGRAISCFLEFLDKEKPDLLVLGRGKASEVESLLLGSTSSKLVRKSCSPILVVKDKRAENPKSILLATDLKESSKKAYDLTLQIAQTFDATIHLAHIVEPGSVTSNPQSFRELKENLSLEGILEEGRKIALEALEQTKESLIDKGLKVEVHALATFDLNPAETLRKLAEEQNVDIITIGSRKMSPVSKWLLGSTTEILINRAPSSVLVIR